jgi:hypothetical protein
MEARVLAQRYSVSATLSEYRPMDASSSQSSRELRNAIRHANRLSKVLVRLEHDRRGGT